MMEHETEMGETGASELAAALTAVGSLDEVIHQKVRLALMSTLISVGESDFTQLRDLISLSDGNLSTHLALLEDRGYVVSTKFVVKRKPKTRYKATVVGREAFREYVRNLEIILGIASGVDERTTGYSVISLLEVPT